MTNWEHKGRTELTARLSVPPKSVTLHLASDEGGPPSS